MYLPVSVYLFIICLTELTVAGQKVKKVPCKMHTFCQDAINFELPYSGFVSCNIKATNEKKKQFSKIINSKK